jgi:hypothetical protein
MKAEIMDTVHALLQESGQAVPAKHISIGKNALQIYDIEHWYENFNSLLLHDFPAVVISIDTSSASLSGFVITIRWTPPLDSFKWVCILAHIVFMMLGLLFVTSCCVSEMQHIEHSDMERTWDMYRGYDHKGNVRVFNEYNSTSPLVEELRAVMI